MPTEALIGPEVPAHLEHRVRTADGRTLGVAEWGDPSGVAVISIHGTPGSRISYWHEPDIYARHGVRRLTFDRPGYGQSTRQPGRHVVDLVADVVAITDALGVREFAVTGGSGGGPHALAVAALLPERVLRCMAIVSLAPWDAEGLDPLAGMTAGNVDEFRATLAGEPAIRKLAEQERETMLGRIAEERTDMLGDAYEMAESDREQMARHFWQMANQMRESLVSGVDGWVDDDMAFVMPWGFDVGSISVPVMLKYGRADTLVPAAHGDWLAARIPGATAVVEDAGHMGDDATFEAELDWLAGHG
jgi:pimeloyl-ACP methyl ester carboxylesterase